MFLLNVCKNAVICKDVNCKDEKHRRGLCFMYNDIHCDIHHALHEGSKPFFKA